MHARRVIQKLSISLLSLAIVLLLCELAARWAEPGPFSLWDRSPYEPAPGLVHEHVPNFTGRWDGTWYEINCDGARGPDVVPVYSLGEYRVLALGDSCTFGKGVLEADSWPRQFEHLLRGALEGDREPLVVNFGVNGYSGRQYLHRLKQYGPILRPNLVVVGYNLNDFPNVVQKVDRAVYQGRKSLRSMMPTDLRNVLGRFALFRWVRGEYYELNRARDWKAAERFAKEIKAGAAQQHTRYELEIERIVGMSDAAHEVGAELAVFLFPYESQVYLGSYDSAAVDWLRDACESRGIVFVSLLEAFRQRVADKGSDHRLFLRGDRYHPNPEGYGIVAERVLEAVRARGWLSQPPQLH
jgi:lysophospholipase L1-like esterase